MNMYAFYLTYINTATNKKEEEHGFVVAGSLEDATDKISYMYEDELTELRLTMFEGYDCGVVEKDALDKAQAWFQRMEQA